MATNKEIEQIKIVPDYKESGEVFDETKTIYDEKGNEITVPGGFKIASDSGDTVQQGVVIEDVNASADTAVQGSQFVWIPVGKFTKDNGEESNEIILGRYTFDETDGTPHLEQAAYTEENLENYKQLVRVNFYNEGYIEYATRSNPDGIASSGSDGLNAIPEATEFAQHRFDRIAPQKPAGHFFCQREKARGTAQGNHSG